MSNSNPANPGQPESDLADSFASPDSEKRRRLVNVGLIALFVIFIDQLTKWIVLQHMHRDQSIDLLGNWLKFTFTENPGMAFGIQYGHPALITVFSVIATGLILFYIIRVGFIYRPYQISLSFVLGGAIGNIIDRIFYGAILYNVPIFQGKVVDFIHVNVWRGVVPTSVPFLGGKFVALFPIWNVADMAIVLGVAGILFFQKGFHERADQLQQDADETLEGAPARTSEMASDLESTTTSL